MRYVFTFTILLAVTVGCGGTGTYFCQDASQCDLRPGGLCLATPGAGQSCAYPDGTCESGYSYDDNGSMTGTCVPPETDIVDAAPRPVDASVDADPNLPDAFDPVDHPDAPVTPDAPPGAPTVCRVTYNVGPSGHQDVYVSDFDGANPLELSGNMGTDNLDGQWSPLGDSIVFSSNRGGSGFDLILVLADGSLPRNLTSSLDTSEGSQDDKLPRWSPDGRRIAWARGRNLYMMSTDGLPPRKLDILRPTAIAWSPDSRFIMFVGATAAVNTELYIVPVAGGSLAQAITNTPEHAEYDVAWSPDGTRVAFARTLGTTSDIWVVDPDGDNPRNLTPDTPDTIDARPVWTPDGRDIVFTSNREGSSSVSQTFRRHRLYRVPVTGGTPTRLTDHEPEGFLNAGDWVQSVAPDGSRILFTRNVSSTTTTVGTVTLDGEDLFTFPPGASYANGVAWSPCD